MPASFSASGKSPLPRDSQLGGSFDREAMFTATDHDGFGLLFQ